MPTTEQRLDTLEAQMAEVQDSLLSKPTISAVRQVLETFETDLETEQASVVAFTDRIQKLERFVTSMKGVLSGLNAAGNLLKSNYSATTNPGVGDDAADGYSVGSNWVNVTLDISWVCLDSTTGTAVWAQTASA